MNALIGNLPAGRPGRILAVALLVATLVLIWTAAVAPLQALYADRAHRLEQRTILADRMATETAALPSLRQRAAQVGGSTPNGLIEAQTDALAAAQLQEAIQLLAGAAGATLSSAETLPSDAVDAYRRVGLRVSLTAAWPVLVDLMARIGQAQPVMLIDTLEIHAAPVVWRDQVASLSAGFTVYGYRAAGAE